jgi:Photosynthetic reaction centre cytochrome C subunit/Tetratricopeptide repeat
MIRRDLSLSIAALAAVLLWPSAARAQQPAAPQRGGGPQLPAPTNLQVLPKDTPPGQVFQIMQNFAGALGVQCGYCHVATPPAEAPAGGAAPAGRGGPPPFNFASDDKPQKKAAREMMLMVRDINPKVAAAVGKSAEAATRVGCVTCHRGVAIPKQLAEILDQTTMEKGTQAAIAQYKDLRKQYFGAQAYDFSEGSLVTYAQRATQANTPDDAITWLQVNLENFPMSSRTYAGLSQAQRAKNDTAAAIKSLEKAVELDPQNAQLKRQLDQLKGQ